MPLRAITSYGKAHKGLVTLVSVFFAVVHLVWLVLSCLANNLEIANVSLLELDTEDDTVKIEFDINWSNSWRDNTNYDAAWVFAKFRKTSATDWTHATLAASGKNPEGFEPGYGTPIEMIVPGDVKGVFIQRSESGSGKVVVDDAQITWAYSKDGLADTDFGASGPQVRVYGIETVYIPAGAFYVGDGNGTNESAYSLHVNNTNSYFQVHASLTPNVNWDSNTTGFVVGVDGDNGLDTDMDGYIENENWPTGYQAFYAMKYEISQGQYRDFLDILTETQQTARVADDTGNDTFVMAGGTGAAPQSRNGIYMASDPGDGSVIDFSCNLDNDTTGDETTDGEWVACNYFKWADFAAYTDWAALRPLTELEFEKLCRGPQVPLYQELSAGIAVGSVTQVTGLTNSGATNEISNNASNYYVYNSGTSGPLRVGFAATASATRTVAAAGYYGCMELSGNVWEMVITLGNSAGRNFAGTHGDGTLESDGDGSADTGQANEDWPDASGGSEATGAGLRGGTWNAVAARMQVSDRTNIGTALTSRDASYGGRAGRTAPEQ